METINFKEEHGIELQVEPTDPEYTQLPITEAFDWRTIVSDVKQNYFLDPAKPLYLVVFRSQLNETADIALLNEYDHRAHEAAKQSPALLYYFAGEPDEQGRALSFCLWSDKEEAKSISRDSRHTDAVKMIKMYDSYALEKYDVFHDDNDIAFVAHP